MNTQPTAPTFKTVPSMLGENQFIGSGYWPRQILVDFAAATIEVAARPEQGESATTMSWVVPNVPLTQVNELVHTLVPHADQALAGSRVRNDVDDGAFRIAFTVGVEDHLSDIDELVDAFHRRWTGRPMPLETISDCAGCGSLIRCSSLLGRWVGDRDKQWKCPGGGVHRPVAPSSPRSQRFDYRPFHDIDAFVQCGAWETTCACGKWSFTGPADRVRVEYFLHVEHVAPDAPFDI